MARDEEIKRRAERVASGIGTKEDLSVLFLWLRRRSHGNHAVADIGDFVGHSDERDRGVAFEGVRSFAHMARGFDFGPNYGLAPPTRKQLIERAWGAFHMSGPERVRKQTGMKNEQAKKLLTRAFKSLLFVNGKYVIAANLSGKEISVVEHFSSMLVSGPAFEDTDLTREFVAALVANSLISRPAKPVPGLHEKLALFAIVAMHRATIILSDGARLPLSARVGTREDGGTLQIQASVPVPNDKPVFFVTPMFTTSLDPEKWCDAELLKHRSWDFPLEIGPDGKLHML